MEEMAAKMSAKKLQRMRKVSLVLDIFRRRSGRWRRGRADHCSDKAAPPRSTDDHSLGYAFEIYLLVVHVSSLSCFTHDDHIRAKLCHASLKYDTCALGNIVYYLRRFTRGAWHCRSPDVALIILN